MRRIDVRSTLVAAVVAFCIVLLLDSVGPLSDGHSFARHVVESLVIAVISGLAVAFSSSWSRPQPTRVVELDPATRARVDDLVAAGKKVQAVKVVRETTGADLRTAVDTVESMATPTGAQDRT